MNDGSPSPLNGERAGVRGKEMNFDPGQNSAISNWN
jgi:hypothetical protein